MELLHEDLVWCLRTLPGGLFKFLRERGPEIAMAGGYIRSRVCGEEPSDVDLFAPSKEAAEVGAFALAKAKEDVYQTDNAFTVRGYKLPVQFIHRWTYARPEDIVPSFDFTIARAAVWHEGEQWKSVCDDRFYPDLAAKRLVYCSPVRNEDAGGSVLRVLKFYRRGYRIPMDSLGAVMARLVNAVDLRKIQGGLEITEEKQWAEVLTDLLREVDPNIDPTHSAHLPATGEPPESPNGGG